MISNMEQQRDSTLNAIIQHAKGLRNYDTKYINYGFFDYKQQLKDKYEQQLNDLKAEKEKLETTVKEKEETIKTKEKLIQEQNDTYVALQVQHVKDI